jgi:hypothetical protein
VLLWRLILAPPTLLLLGAAVIRIALSLVLTLVLKKQESEFIAISDEFNNAR